MEYSEYKVRTYAHKCFKDAFKAVNKKYGTITDTSYSFEWVMVKNLSGMYQMFPLVGCKYALVTRRVLYRLRWNLEKNLGIICGNTNELRYSFNRTGRIDLNHTQAVFKDKETGKLISLSVFDKRDNRYENDNLRGECMPAYTFERLLFAYWGLDKDSYNALNSLSPKRHLPNKFSKDWNSYKELYKKAFGVEAGSMYEIINSSGLERL